MTLVLYAIDFKTNGSTITYTGERVFVHTDRDIYIAGENVFFKLYLINDSSHKLSETSKIAYLILRSSASVPIAKIRIKTEGGIAYGNILLPDTLSSGPYQLTAFTNWMRNSGEGSFFNKEIFVANRFDKDLSVLDTSSGPAEIRNVSTAQDATGNLALIVTPDKSEYNKREKINLVLKFFESESGVPADISISVFEEVPGTDNKLSIRNYLSMKPGDSLSLKFPDPEKWRFLPELKGEILQGKVIDQDSRGAVANSCVFLSVKDSVVNLKYDYSDANGLFRFLLNDYYDGKDLIFSLKDNPANKKYKIELEDKFELDNIFKSLKYQENPYLKDYILKSQDIVSIQKVYQAASATEIKKQFKTNIICPRIYYKPSYSISPDDFVPLNDFVDISREILPPQLRIRKHNDKYSADMADENQHLFLEQEPAVFLDGVLVDDINQIINLGSGKVKKVEMVCTRYNYGELLFPGILAVFSKNNEIENIQPRPISLRVQLESYHAYSVYTSQTYEKASSDNQPDFRQLLYWNPDIEISNNYIQIPEFYASDHSGNYIIEVEGISSDGVPISATAKIKVK